MTALTDMLTVMKGLLMNAGHAESSHFFGWGSKMKKVGEKGKIGIKTNQLFK